MQIRFKSIVVEGFRSIVDEQSFNLEQPGLNMVKGTNGKGKTTLFEALIWCLYGANLKGTVSGKVQSWKEVRGDKYKGTGVNVRMTVGKDKYEIARFVKHKDHGDSLMVFKNGERTQELDKKDTQLFIDELLTMDFNTFMNSFMFGQRMTRLVEASSVEKRKLFEELFDMEWIQRMREKAVEDRAETEKKLIAAEQRYDRKQLSINMQQDAVDEAKLRLENQQRDEENYKIDIGLEINEHEDEYEKYGLEKLKIEKEIADLPITDGVVVNAEDLTADITKLEYALSEADDILRQHSDELLTLKSKRESLQEALDDYDSSRYDRYQADVVNTENQMKDLVAKLYDDSSALLTEEEQMEISHEYEVALISYITKQDLVNKLFRQSQEDPESVCPTCNRPFDNADEIEEHAEHIKKQLADADKELSISKMLLDSAMAAANILAEYQKLEQTLKTLKSNVPADPDVDKAEIREAISEFSERIVAAEKDVDKASAASDALSGQLDSLRGRQDAYEEQMEKNRELIGKRQNLEIKLADTVSNMEKTREAITKLEESLKVTKLPELQKELDEKAEKMESFTGELSTIQAEIVSIQEELDVINFWVKDVFASNGLKAYIFKAMLDKLNQHTAKYGAKLGCSMRFSLDLSKTSAPFSTICTLGNKVNKDYKEFSGGEKQRLDIVLMFAMHDLLSSATDINVLIMDEVFEGLDEQGESDVFELISEKAQGRSVFVISHSQVLDTLHSNTIQIDNVNGKTILP